jgi:hypothetical protein
VSGNAEAATLPTGDRRLQSSLPENARLPRSNFYNGDRLMIRTLSIASVIALGLAYPAFAADAPAPAATAAAAETGTDPAAIAMFTKMLSDAANAKEARKFLMAKGYTDVSELQRDGSGRWAGTATKNGKQVGVALDLTPKAIEVPSTN